MATLAFLLAGFIAGYGLRGFIAYLYIKKLHEAGIITPTFRL